METTTSITLWHAVSQLDAQLISDLIRRGHDPNEISVYHETPTHALFRCANEESKPFLASLKALLEGKANPNETEGHGITPLMVAARRNWTRAVSFLLEHGASLYYTDGIGLNFFDTALHHAIESGCLETATLLAKREEGIQVSGLVYRRRLTLLEIPAKRTGLTPYLAACASAAANVEMLIMLEKHGAKVQAVTQRKQNAWHLAADSCYHGGDLPRYCSSLKFQHLFELGLLGMDREDEWANTPLHYAAQRGCVANVSILLLNGAKIDHQNKHRITPLVEAVEKARPGVVKLLTRTGADRSILYNFEGTWRNVRESASRKTRVRHLDARLRLIKAIFDEADKQEEDAEQTKEKEDDD